MSRSTVRGLTRSGNSRLNCGHQAGTSEMLYLISMMSTTSGSQTRNAQEIWSSNQ
jgi:hypothetical protein